MTWRIRGRVSAGSTRACGKAPRSAACGRRRRPAGVTYQSGHPFAIREGQREGDLHEHVSPRLEGRDRLLGMDGVRRGDDDSLHALPREEVRGTIEFHRFDPMVGGKSLRRRADPAR